MDGVRLRWKSSSLHGKGVFSKEFDSPRRERESAPSGLVSAIFLPVPRAIHATKLEIGSEHTSPGGSTMHSSMGAISFFRRLRCEGRPDRCQRKLVSAEGTSSCRPRTNLPYDESDASNARSAAPHPEMTYVMRSHCNGEPAIFCTICRGPVWIGAVFRRRS